MLHTCRRDRLARSTGEAWEQFQPGGEVAMEHVVIDMHTHTRQRQTLERWQSSHLKQGPEENITAGAHKIYTESTQVREAGQLAGDTEPEIRSIGESVRGPDDRRQLLEARTGPRFVEFRHVKVMLLQTDYDGHLHALELGPIQENLV